MNYLSFFSLRQEPFSNAPVSRFYFNSEQHARALVRMMFAIENMKGLAVLSGNIGAGKSTTARRILESLPEDRYEVALMVMVQSGVSPHWFLTKIAYQLGVAQPADDKTRLLGQLYRRLYSLHQAGRNAVVLVDEAQMLDSRELMEEIRGLLNMEIPEKKLLTLCLFGLPEMEEHLKLDPPLYQRIAVRGRLGPLSPEGTEAYIKHRLRLAGARRMLFTQEAVQSIHRATRGVPRLINTVCDNALFEGFLSRVNPITSRVVDSVVKDLCYDGVTELGGAAAGERWAPTPGEPSPGASLGWDAGRDFRGPSSRPEPSLRPPGRSQSGRSAVAQVGAELRPAQGTPPSSQSLDSRGDVYGFSDHPGPSRIESWVEEARAWGQREGERRAPQVAMTPQTPAATAPVPDEEPQWAAEGDEGAAFSDSPTDPGAVVYEEAEDGEEDAVEQTVGSEVEVHVVASMDSSRAAVEPIEALELAPAPPDAVPMPSAPEPPEINQSADALVELGSDMRSLPAHDPLASLEASLASLPPAPDRTDKGEPEIDDGPERDDPSGGGGSVLGAAASVLRAFRPGRKEPNNDDEPPWRRRVDEHSSGERADGGGKALDRTGTDGGSIASGWFRRRGRK